MAYNPNLNTAVYSTTFLEARARALRFKLTRGTAVQRASPAIAGELAAIDAELADRLNPKPRPVKRPVATPFVAPSFPGVPYLASVPDVPRRKLGSGPYSAAVVAVEAAYNPKPHSQYR